MSLRLLLKVLAALTFQPVLTCDIWSARYGWLWEFRLGLGPRFIRRATKKEKGHAKSK